MHEELENFKRNHV
jgi:hypothetical protein